jgi:eukaryotic-like serine/threonine-protein kinase
MAPEQLSGDRCDERTDIWSAGVVLYELATGSLLFPQATAPVLMSAILKVAPKASATINPSISLGLQNVIFKALEKDPNRPYQSAAQLRTDLETLTRPGRSAFGGKRLTVRNRRVPCPAVVVSALQPLQHPLTKSGRVTHEV